MESKVSIDNRDLMYLKRTILTLKNHLKLDIPSKRYPNNHYSSPMCHFFYNNFAEFLFKIFNFTLIF